jgi:hypothetical protein
MAKQKPAGVTDKDLPWWFEIYHTAWIVFFPAVWYFFGGVVCVSVLTVIAALFVMFA